MMYIFITTLIGLFILVAFLLPATLPFKIVYGLLFLAPILLFSYGLIEKKRKKADEDKS